MDWKVKIIFFFLRGYGKFLTVAEERFVALVT